MKKNQRKIKNFFLYKTFQQKIITFVIIINLCSTFILYLGVRSFFKIFTSKGSALGLPPHHIFFKFIHELQDEMNLIFLGTSIFTALIASISAYILSHKVAGPLYRLREELKSMASNKILKKIKFRDKDDIKEIEHYFNQVVEQQNETN